jgi:predicted CXXCH cytochrome family protein
MNNDFKTSGLVLLLVVAIAVAAASLAQAATGNIRTSKHDFSSGTGGSPQWTPETSISEVCVFCHTPHNAGRTNALWNKAGLNSATNFRLYTSSKTLTSITKQSKLTADSPSLLCLSCHDGKTAMNVMHNSGTGASAGPSYPAGAKFASGASGIYAHGEFDDGFGGTLPSINIGGIRLPDGTFPDGSAASAGDNLTDDHPIGFDYKLAAQEKGSSLRPVGTVNNKIRFFNGVSSYKVECSTCHDPHSTTSPPFLVMSNTGSALCLACHNK